MKDKTTMSVDKTTTELVKKVKRKMSFDQDQDFTTDEALSRLCIAYLGDEATSEGTDEQTPAPEDAVAVEEETKGDE